MTVTGIAIWLPVTGDVAAGTKVSVDVVGRPQFRPTPSAGEQAAWRCTSVREAVKRENPWNRQVEGTHRRAVGILVRVVEPGLVAEVRHSADGPVRRYPSRRVRSLRRIGILDFGEDCRWSKADFVSGPQPKE